MSFRVGQLRYFVTVANEGQITRAAANLHLAQPALSQAIAQLEAELGMTLFERHSRGVSLTSAGEAFLPKAEAAVAGEDAAVAVGEALKRSAGGVVEVGFIGPPPTVSNPELFGAFSLEHPEVEVSFRDLPFPRGPTLDWLRDVDVAVCVRPEIDRGVGTQVVRRDLRAVVVNRSHPLAGKTEISFEEVLEETFISFHPAVQATWTAFHNLDDHRGGPPRSVTTDRASSSLQMLGIMTTRGGITTAPLTDAQLAMHVSPEVVAIPVIDAAPATVSLVWPKGSSHSGVRALASVAKRLDDLEGSD
jgi:LysR family transcriptional regulator, benzoate and cis,cis-muconate-responsive activator of ben and cat genes